MAFPEFSVFSILNGKMPMQENMIVTSRTHLTLSQKLNMIAIQLAFSTQERERERNICLKSGPTIKVAPRSPNQL
jgi:hypothetical protein